MLFALTILLILLTFLIFSGSGRKEQVLIEKQVALTRPSRAIKNADLDYNFLNNIDAAKSPFPAGSRYQIGDIPTVKGSYTVYKFIIEYQGESAERGKMTFHDLLALKTDSTGKILDAYQYTLEWADSPSLALLKLGAKDVMLKPGLKLTELKMARVATRYEPLAPEQKILSPTGERVDMGQMFASDKERYLKQADEIIDQADSYQEAREKLIELQRVADNSWKGHGPQILDKALQKLSEKKF
jgi:hypothetical protein